MTDEMPADVWRGALERATGMFTLREAVCRNLGCPACLLTLRHLRRWRRPLTAGVTLVDN